MTKMLVQAYSSKATAVRGAKRAGLVGFEVTQRESDGKWIVVDPKFRNLEPGTYAVEVTDVKLDEESLRVDVGVKLATPQPELSTETREKAEKTIMMAKEDLAKLASTLPAPVQSTPEEIKARREERRNRIEAEKKAAADAPKIPSYKELYRSAPKKSQIEKPVKFVHEYLAQHYGKRSRKALIAELVAFGLNVTMCRSQYQIYRRKLGEVATK